MTSASSHRWRKVSPAVSAVMLLRRTLRAGLWTWIRLLLLAVIVCCRIADRPRPPPPDSDFTTSEYVFTLPATGPGPGAVLQSDGQGNLSWVSCEQVQCKASR